MDILLEPFTKYKKYDDESFEFVKYPGVLDYRYVISNYGRVFSYKRCKELKFFLDKDGYKRIGITRYLPDGRKLKSPVSVHRMVAFTFVPNDYDLNTVNHKDGIKLNNKYTNLEWTTVKGNTQHAIQTGLRQNHRFIVHDESLIRKICEYLESGMDYKEIYTDITGHAIIVDKAIYMLIRRIKRGEAFPNISKEYDIFGGYISSTRTKFDKETVDKIKTMIIQGLSNKEILKAFGFKTKRESSKSRRYYDKILAIRRSIDICSSTRES